MASNGTEEVENMEMEEKETPVEKETSEGKEVEKEEKGDEDNEKSEKDDKAEKAEKDDKPEKSDKIEENGKDEKTEKTEKKDDENASSVVADHYNKLEEKGLYARSQSRILYLRNFNNWTKSMVIGDTLRRIRQEHGDHCRVRVLDIGSGKGGDLLKWKKGRIYHLICADIAGTSVQQCKERYRDMVSHSRRTRDPDRFYRAEFIQADCTKTRLRKMYRDPDVKFDLVSCQFTFHYCFESLPQAVCMLKNITERLRPGGYFIGTTPDAFEIKKRLDEAQGLTFGNDVYKIAFDSKLDKTKLPLFGAKYEFYLEGVVDCPEFLVYFPALEKLASQYGLKLVYKKRFDDFFEEQRKTDEGKFLLRKISALETYPPRERQQSLGKESDYEVAKKRVEELKQEKEKEDSRNHNILVGTMSKAEWEAICMYTVFAFQKQKPDEKREN